jgi:hypothetical protein
VPWDAGGLGDPGDHPVGVAAVDWLAGRRPQHQRAFGAFAAAGLENPQHRDGEWHGGGLVALAHQAQHPVAAQGLGVVLDPYRRGLRRPKRVDPEEVGQGAVVDADGRGDLEKPDQLVTIQSLGAGLVAVNLRQPRVDGGV